MLKKQKWAIAQTFRNKEKCLCVMKCVTLQHR